MRALERLWWRRAEPAWTEAWAFPLSLASLAFRAGTWLARALARPQRANAKVIAVGNLAVGGAGKTPVAMLLCERLRARGAAVALLSRGHGRTSRAAVSLVCAGAGPLLGAEEAGDEPLQIARRLPWLTVLVGPDRRQLAAEADRRGAQVLVLDDGLQQRALAADLTLVVLDAENPLGNGRLLPRGPLREGAAALERAGARGLLWLSNAGDRERHAPELARLLERARRAGLRGPVEAEVRAVLPDELVGVPTFALAGIARPERFLATLRAIRLELRGARLFADHHRFRTGELREVRAAALGAGARAIATTEKDAARLGAGALAGEPPIIPVPIELALVRGEEALAAALDDLLGGAARGPTRERGGGAQEAQ